MKRNNLNKGLVDFSLCWKSHNVTRNPSRPEVLRYVPAPRHSHSAILENGDEEKSRNIMWIFGGSSLTGAFNDLWGFDLSKREWFHPKSTGNYPNPKACCSLVQYKNQLILFGGWRQGTAPHQPHILFNELHIYDLAEHRWTIKNFTYGPSPIAAHSATVHGSKMIVFGGYRGLDNEAQGTTNEIWILDLLTWTWKKPKILDRRPNARYGHFQVKLDDEHLLVIGGSGGVNNMFNDAWLLQMRTDIWKWEPVTIKNKKFTASHMWCHPAAFLPHSKKFVVLGPTPAMPVDHKIPKQLPSNRLRPPSAEERRAAIPAAPAVPARPERPRSVENQRPPAPQQGDELINNRNNFNDAALRLQRSLYIRSWDPNLPRRFNEPIIHGTIKMAAFNVDNNSQLPQAIQRERQLENLRRMEQKLQRQRVIQRREEEARKQTKRAKTNCLAMFVCDFTFAASQGTIEWLEYQNNGLLPNAPEKNILSSLVAGTGELIIFGGLQKEASNETVTSAVHFLTVPQTMI